MTGVPVVPIEELVELLLEELPEDELPALELAVGVVVAFAELLVDPLDVLPEEEPLDVVPPLVEPVAGTDPLMAVP